jgi:hypothetical protein
VAPTFWTMTLAGVWHGAGGQFVIFGLLHSTYITLFRIWSTFGRKRRRFKKGEPIDFAERCEIAVSVVITLLCVSIADVFFRAANVGQAMSLLACAAGRGPIGVLGPGELHSLAAPSLVLAGLFAVIWFSPNVYQIFDKASPALAVIKEKAPAWLIWRPKPAWAAVTGSTGAAAILAIGRASQFLYFQF